MKKTEDKHSFLSYRKEQEKEHLKLIENTDNPLHSILTVEMNLTELCNRKCVFCPRHDPEVYPNRNLNTTVEDASIIAKRLADFNYVGRRCNKDCNFIIENTHIKGIGRQKENIKGGGNNKQERYRIPPELIKDWLNYMN